MAHGLGMNGVDFLNRAGIACLLAKPVAPNPVKLMGLTFPSPVGLAAGLDKNGEHIDALASLGFGFIEIGTVTPRPQPGNPKPRMFRITEKQAIINRMGFNNHGVDQLLANVAKSKFARSGGVLGINTGKNFDTPIEKAADDYLICLDRVYASASYIAINISSPNTKNLRELQKDDALDALLGQLKTGQARLADKHGKYVPLVLKIAPDLEDEQIQSIADLLRQHRMDGVIATNTTLSRAEVEGFPNASEAGGLSGAPVFERSTTVLKKLAGHLAGEVPIIGVGGIMKGEDAVAKLDAGASLVQLYSGFIYRGPELVGEVAKAIAGRNH
ncbi:MAG: quinone-dependent dihydroorotate dehydrogenase [Propionivibrio sp.]|nr:quinone-dependent dihydroorotate dehydrogenase [Propionivibrio sp.]